MNDDDTSASIHGERDNFDSIDEKMEEGKETRDGEAYDEGFYRLTVSGKKNVQGAIQALVGENGEYGALVLQDEGGSMRLFLNPKAVDMERVTTLAQAQEAVEQKKREIEEANRQKIAAWEARTGLAYDPDWRAKQQAEAQAQAVGQEQEATPEAQVQEEEPATALEAEEALKRAGERFRNKRAADAIAQDTALPETSAEGAPDLAGLAGNTALSVGDRAQTEAKVLRDEWRTFRKDGMRPGFRRAANGKVSNLDEREWLLARTAAFKQAAGDWEALMKRRELDAKPVTHIEPNVIKAGEGLSAIKAALAWAKKNLPVQAETAIGTLVADERSVKSSLSHSYSQEKLDAVVSLKNGIHQAVYLGSLPDAKRTTSKTIDHYFAYPAEYKGKRKLVFLRAIEDVNKNRVYVHEVFDETSLIEQAETKKKRATPFKPGLTRKACRSLLEESHYIKRY